MQKREAKRKIVLKGAPLSGDFSHGTAYVYSDILHSKQAAYNIRKDEYDSEFARIHSAKESVRRQLSESARRVGVSFSKDVADIFLAQEAMLTDPQLVTDLKRTLRQKHINAERVIAIVFQRWIQKFRDSSSKMLNERADDIEDLYRRMLTVLIGVEAHRLENLPENTIIVARRLLPSDTVFLSRRSCAGILLEVAGPTAHSTILARELGVPCVGQISNLLANIRTRDELLLNGNAGTVIVNPDRDSIKAFDAARRSHGRRFSSAWKRRFETACTIDGQTITVMANVGSRDDVEHAIESGADGIGLFRTEGFFLAAKRLPTVEEFGGFLSESLEPAREKTANVRLLDIGGDKSMPYLSLPFEPNPFLGRRGVRLLFSFPELLRVQLEAMVSVSRAFRVRILVPMVTLPEEVTRIRKLLNKISKKHHQEPPPLGAMVETPAAALNTESLAKQADFLCLGTNDLTQYVMAADRESALIGEYFKDDHPIMLNLLRSVVDSADKTPVTLCGELAGKRESFGAVLETAITSISIAPPGIPKIKDCIRTINLSIKKRMKRT